jgi:hypothetical protein
MTVLSSRAFVAGIVKCSGGKVIAGGVEYDLSHLDAFIMDITSAEKQRASARSRLSLQLPNQKPDALALTGCPDCWIALLEATSSSSSTIPKAVASSAHRRLIVLLSVLSI